MSEKIKKVVAILITAKEEVAAELQGTEFENINLRVKHSIDQMVNLMSHYGNLEVTHVAAKAQEFGPIKDFFGEKVDGLKAVTKEDVEPDKDAKKQFKEKVNALHDSFLERDDEELLKNNTIQEDQLALRGVAKRAGIVDFADRELNIQFIQDIKAGIRAKNEEKALAKSLKDFDTAVAAGDAAVKAKKWEDAKIQFESAAALFPDNEYPKTQLEVIAKNLKK